MRVLAMNRTRRSPVIVILLALVASIFSLVAAAPDAAACSIAPPMVEVSPSENLAPGDVIKVRGYGFVETRFTPVEPEVDENGDEIPLDSCAGIDFVPVEVAVSWSADHVEHLASVKGPDFEIEVRVPKWVEPGPAIILANWVEAYVSVGGTDPCVWPAGSPEKPARVDHLSPECPEPCVVYLHADDAKPHRAGPICPDPCGFPAVPEVGVWCPDPCLDPVASATQIACPEPCPLTVTSPGGDAGHVCPDPCEVYIQNERIQLPEPMPPCPDPCVLPGGPHAAVWCPPPCPFFDGDYAGAPCPEPCWEYLDTTGNYAYPPCPEPCGVLDADGAAMFGPCPFPVPLPDPLPVPLPDPLPVPLPDPLPVPLPAPAPVEQTDTAGSVGSTIAPTRVDHGARLVLQLHKAVRSLLLW